MPDLAQRWFESPNYQVQRRHASASARGRAATSRARGSAARGRALYASRPLQRRVRRQWLDQPRHSYVARWLLAGSSML
jgi:hypothetical protein